METTFHKGLLARMYLQLPLWQWDAGNVYLLVLSSLKVNIAKKLHCRNGVVDTVYSGNSKRLNSEQSLISEHFRWNWAIFL